MANTNTERSRNHRKKMKRDLVKYTVYKNKDRERKRVERSKPKSGSSGEIDRQKKLNRNRVRRCRIAQKAKTLCTCPVFSMVQLLLKMQALLLFLCSMISRKSSV